MIQNKGLTLIELLVVIAIIGLLASIMLVNMAGARARARDARVITAMDQIRSRAEIIYHQEGRYTKVFCQQIKDPCECQDPAGKIDILCTDMVKNAVPDTVFFWASGEAYCVEAQLQGTGKFWCIDSKLHSKEYDNSSCFPSGKECAP